MALQPQHSRGSDDLVVVDPTVTEENIMDGELTVVMNIQREVCAVSKVRRARGARPCPLAP